MTDSRRVIYVASPLRGNYTLNTEMAKTLGRELHVRSEGRRIPFVPHLHFTQFLNDTDEIDRGYGMDAARYMLHRCDELWIFDGIGLSEGMVEEEAYARSIGLPIRHFPTLTHWKSSAMMPLEPGEGDDLQGYRLAKRWEKTAEVVAAREIETLEAIASIVAPDAIAEFDGIKGMGEMIIERTGQAVAEVMTLRERTASLEEQLAGMVMSRDQAIGMKNTAEERLENSRTELAASWKKREEDLDGQE